MRNERRVTVYLSEEEYELLVERENESGKSRSKILKESLYREQNIMDAIKAAKMEELYRRAYKILYDNRDFLLAVQKELLEHETLLNSDLAKIRESCT